MSAVRLAAAGILAGAVMFASGCGATSTGDWTIVFPAARDGDWGMYAVQPDDDLPLRIAEADGPMFDPPVASPDGRKLVLPLLDGLVVMSADGTSRKLLTKEAAYWTAVWSPDSTKIVFERWLHTGLWSIDADGGRPLRLTRRRTDSEPAWSPDGNVIAFVREGRGILLVDADGTGHRLLWRSRGASEQIHWSSDGGTLTFLHDPDPSSTYGEDERELITIAAADGRVLRRVAHVVPFQRIAWSPDGGRLAFVPDDTGPWRIVTMNADGSARRTVARGRAPVWSPDGKTIVYLGHQQIGGDDLRSVRADGTGMRILTRTYPNGVEPAQPMWLRGRLRHAPSSYRLASSEVDDGAALELPFPVVDIVAAGSRVAILSPQRVWAPLSILTPPLVLWEPDRGRAWRLSLASCQQPGSVAVLDAAVAVECPWRHAAYARESILLFREPWSRPREIVTGEADLEAGPEWLPSSLAGHSRVVAYATTRWTRPDEPARIRLWTSDGTTPRLLAAGVDAGAPAAMDGGRIAVVRADGTVAVIREDGQVIGRIAWDLDVDELDPSEVDLAGSELVVLLPGRLQVYDAGSLELRASVPVDRRARLAGVASGVVAYTVGPHVRLLRLRDGHTAVLDTSSRGQVQAAITDAGLFYARHDEALPLGQFPSFRANPATVVFVRWAGLVRRLR